MLRRPTRNNKVVNKSEHTLLVDGNSLYKTGFFAAKDEYNSDGQHIGGLYAFLNILRKILDEGVYDNLFVFWDGDFSGKLRYEFYKEYKANRNKDFDNGTRPIDQDELRQRRMVWGYLNDLCVRQLTDSCVESDDFIGYYCLNRKKNEKITIVSNDRDFLQLLSEDVRIYMLNLKAYITLENYREYFDWHLDNSMLIKMMIGDTADNIKGVKGLGEKTLLDTFPELKERKLTIGEILSIAAKKQAERVEGKLKPLKVLDNIINGVTDGSQEMLYEVNERLVNLKKPLLTENAKSKLEYIKVGYEVCSDIDLQVVFSKMKEHGLDAAIGERRYPDFLVPFKKLLNRNKDK